MAINVVVANMIGTGIFTTLGFQVAPNAIPDIFTILFIWTLGGILALCGATCYIEIATAFKENGGEYTFLRRLYHPILGITSGVVSLISGFSAAIAGLALAAGEYLKPSFGSDNAVYVSVALLTFVFLFQTLGVLLGGYFQVLFTGIKVLTIVIIIALPILFQPESGFNPDFTLLPTPQTWNVLFSYQSANALIWVMFAYSGWNAAIYITENLKEPIKNLPKALIYGTVFVMLIYLLVNISIMYSVPFSKISGVVDVANVVSQQYAGDWGSLTYSILVSISLLAGMNAMFISGSRVFQKMAVDFRLPKFFSSETPKGSPVVPSFFVYAIALFFVLFSNFQTTIEFVGITLTLYSSLVVFGVFLIRQKNTEYSHRIKAIGYPLTPILFLVGSCWMFSFCVSQNPASLIYALLPLVPASFIYYFTEYRS